MPDEFGSAGDAGNPADGAGNAPVVDPVPGDGDGDGGALSLDNWRDAIPKEYAEDASLANIKTIDDLAKSYVNAQKMIGSENRVKIPEADASAEEMMEFYNKVGRPKDPSGYDFKLQEDAPQEFESEEAQQWVDSFRKNSHDLGLTKAQAEALWDAHQKDAIDNYNKASLSFKQQVEELEENSRKEFGTKLPEVVKIRSEVINTFGDAAAFDVLVNNPINARSPELLKMFEKIGKALGEDKLTREVKTRPLSPKEARSKINDLVSNKQNPLHEAYQDPNHARHKEAVEEFHRLHEQEAAGK